MISSPKIGLSAIEAALSVIKGDRLWLKFKDDRFFQLVRDGEGWRLHDTKLEISKKEVEAKGYGSDIRSESRSISLDGQSDGLEKLLDISRTEETEKGGVFWIPAGIDANLPLKECIKQADVLSCEIDDASRDEQLERYQWFSSVSGLAYGLQLSSGSKSIHSHVFLDEPAPIDTVVRLRRLFVLCLLGDPAVTRPHQPMRFPGFYRIDKGNYQELLALSEARYSLVEVEQGLQSAFADLGWAVPVTLSDALWADLQRTLKNKELASHEKQEAIARLLERGDEHYQQQARERAERQQAQQIRFAQQQLSGEFSLFDAIAQIEQRLSPIESFNAAAHDWDFSGHNHARGMCEWHPGTTNSAWLSQVDGKWVFHCPTCTDDKPISAFQYWLYNQRGVGQMPTGKDWADSAKEWLALHGVTLPEQQRPPSAAGFGKSASKPILKAKAERKSTSAVSEVQKLDNSHNRGEKAKKPKKANKAKVDPETQAKLDHYERIHAAASKLSLQPDLIITSQYLPKGELPEPGSLLLIDAPMGTGKTASQLKGIVEQHKAKYPNAKILSLVSRNVLGRQQATELGLIHQESIQGEHGDSPSWVGCPNSLYQIRLKNIPEGSLLLLDEMEALIRYLLCSSTLKDDRLLIIGRFRDWVRHILRNDGFIVGCEDGLSDLSLNFLKEIIGFEFPIKFIKSEWKNPEPYPVSIFTSSSAWVESLPSENIVIASDAIAQVRELAEILPDSKTIVASGDTSQTDEIKGFANNPDLFLRANPSKINLIYSPTLAEGVSITEPRYDVRGGYFVHLPPRDIKQQLNRYRGVVPTVIYCKANAVNKDDLGLFDADILIERFYEDAKEAQQLMGFAEYLKGHDESLMSKLGELSDRRNAEVNLWLSYRMQFEARDNWYKRDLRANLIKFLESRGHAVSVIDAKASPGFGAIRKEIREKVDRDRSNKFASVIVPGELDASAAFEVLRSSSSSLEERTAAKKCILEDELKHCNLDDPDFIYKAVIKERGRFLARTRSLWRALNPDGAKAYDRWTLFNTVAKARMRGEGIFLPDVSMHSVAAECIANSPFFEALRKIKDSKYSNESPELAELEDWAKSNSNHVFKKLRLTIKPEHSAVNIFNRLARKLGYVAKRMSQKGSRGKRSGHYQIIDFYNSDRENILKSLTEKFEAKLDFKREAPDGSPLQVFPGIEGERIGGIARQIPDKNEDEWKPIAQPAPIPILMTRLQWCLSAEEYKEIRGDLESHDLNFATQCWPLISELQQNKIRSFFEAVS
jgi:hypothetical protein